jgi:hypothetical protein
MRCLIDMLSLPQNQGVGKGRPTRRDMNRAAASKVKRGQIVQPSIAVPRPAGHGAVDYGGPAEAEDQRRKHIPSFKCAAHNDHHLKAPSINRTSCAVLNIGKSTYRACAEQKLVEAEHDLWQNC